MQLSGLAFRLGKMHQLMAPNHGAAMAGCGSCNLLDELPSFFKDANGLELFQQLEVLPQVHTSGACPLQGPQC